MLLLYSCMIILKLIVSKLIINCRGQETQQVSEEEIVDSVRNFVKM